MGRIKRKSSKELNKEESFVQNRSSLDVNLSCSNLTDSGNGSFKTMEMGHNILTNSMRSTRSTRSKTRLKTASKKDICLQDARVVLEDISRTDKSLNIRSQKLTDAILNKTREIFHKENELSIKTSMVLQNIGSARLTNNMEHNNEGFIPKSTTGIINNGHGNSCQTDKNPLYHNICTTPKKQKEQKALNKYNVHEKQQLHLEEEYFNDKVLRQDNSDFRNATINASPSSNTRSPILSQSRRKLNASKFLMPRPKKLNTRNKCRQSGSRYLYNQQRQSSQSSISSTLSDESMFKAFPIACSTMIEECTSSQSKLYAGVETSYLQSQVNTHTDKTLSMDTTDLRGGFIIEESNASECQFDGSYMTHKSRESNVDKENNIAVAKRLATTQMQKSKGQYATRKGEVNTNQVSRNAQQNLDDIEDSINSLQSSLNVNTSIDAITENNKVYTNGSETIRTQDEQLNSIRQGVNDAHKIISEEEQESINTMSVSLQMNTSLRRPYGSSFRRDSMRQLHHSKNSDESNALHGASSTDTIQIYNKENSGNSIRNNENMAKEQPETQEHNITIKNKSKSTPNENGRKSYIEPTPYPPTRSMMWRSIIKHNTEMQSIQNDNAETTNHNTYTKKSDVQEYGFNTAHMDRIMSQIERNIAAGAVKNTTIILDDSDVAGLPSGKRDNSVSVADSDADISQDTESSKRKDPVDTSAESKTQRKKLFPIRENSGLLSFSPIEDSCSAPTQSVFPRNRKKITKKDIKSKSKTVTLPNLSNKETNKEPKKTRRIKSKKIVIKKVTNVDILKTLERERRAPNKSLNSTGYNTASPSEFENKKYISTAKSTRGLGRRVIIVTTGLSKQDKSLVKSVIRSIGKAKMELSVSPQTTYVVTTGVRTLNLLHGIIRGCWLVTMEWILKSLENKQWLNPEEYEIEHFSEAIRANRKERMRAEQYGVSFVPDLFAATGLIYVENGTTPPSNALKDLIKAGGGRITENEDTAKIVIGSTGLKESWMLDCITTGKLQSCAQYKRN